MPLNKKGKKIKRAMIKEYGSKEKGDSKYYDITMRRMGS